MEFVEFLEMIGRIADAKFKNTTQEHLINFERKDRMGFKYDTSYCKIISY